MRRRPTALLLALALVAVVAGVAADGDRALAADRPPVTVRVTLLEIEDLGDDLDDASDADFYGQVVIGATSHENEDTPASEAAEGEEHVYPNWEFSAEVDQALGSVPVRIVVRDEDGLFNGADDLAWVAPNDGVVDLDVKLRPCAISGDVTGACATQLTTSDADRLVFRVDVLRPPASPGLRVQCLHSPLWPQPGDPVTVTATAVDGDGRIRDFSVPGDRVDQVGIDVGGAPAALTASGTSATATFVAGGTSLSYECWATHDGGRLEASTWPRTVRVGPEAGRAVPVVYTGPTASRIDVVVFADAGFDPTAIGGETFVQHTQRLLGQSLFGVMNDQRTDDAGNPLGAPDVANDYVLSHQGWFNVWLGQSGGADISRDDGDCELTPPRDWDEYAFADAGVVLHSDLLRDCADMDERFSGVDRADWRTLLHELGHTPFGLSDEYPLDDGYWQDDFLPNVYDDYDDCIGDAPAGSPCRSFQDDDDDTWFTSDPASDDLMVDRGQVRFLDRRRFDHLLLTQCPKAGC